MKAPSILSRRLLANRLKDATGVSLISLPFSADSIFSKLSENKS